MTSRSPLTAPLRALGVVLVAVIFAGFGYTVGMHDSARTVVPDGEGRVVNQGGEPKGLSDDVDFSTFWDVWSLVRSSYVDQPVSEKNLYYGSVAGMVAGLHDPYSNYFTPEEAQAFNEELSGTFFGIGAQLDQRDGNIVVIAPLPGTPAERAGILAEDFIVSIDGVSTEGMVLNEAVNAIRGEKGTTVTLGIVHKDTEDIVTMPIVRDEIKTESVTYTFRDDGIAVIEVSMFNEDTSSLFRTASQRALKDGATGIILDLRNNPGGLLDAAIDLAGYWVPSGSSVLIEEIRGTRDEFPANGLAQLREIPTVVLVNGGSASASEILAGALQDYGEARVIGDQTFGKGSVQEYHDLPDGGAVKITVARWLTPLGRSIDQTGITPDDIVSLTLDDVHAKRDPQFTAALDFFTKK